jgi:L-asparaginase/Glu-tRNA(Gln) amidotransferase subunit D
MQTVYVIATGGTIEKVYKENTGSVENLENKITRYLRFVAAARSAGGNLEPDEQGQPGNDCR